MTDCAAIWYEMYGAAVLSFICSRGFTIEDAEDIRSQVFLEVVKKQEELQDTAPRSFLFTLARSRMVDRWRTEKRTEALHLGIPDSQDIEAIVIERDAEARLREVIAGLPKSHRITLTLRFLKELSLQETAATLNTTVGIIKARQHRAQQALQRAYL